MAEKKNGLTQTEEKMFGEIALILNKYKGQTRSFNLALNHSHFRLKKGEVLHETNDKVKRIMEIRPQNKVSISESSHPTMWRVFQKVGPEVVQFCCDTR